MKKVIFTLIISIMTLPVFAMEEQVDTTATDTLTSTTVINHYHETKFVTRVVRDTVYTTPHESYLLVVKEQQAAIDSLAAQLARLMISADNSNQKAEKSHRFNMILLVFILVFIVFLAVMMYKKPSEPVKEEVPAAPEVVKPSIQAYSNSVHKFTVINDNISSLRKKDNKELINSMFRYLSGIQQSTEALVKEIKTIEMPEETKEQFVSLVSEMSAFMSHDKPIIDAWLADNEEQGIKKYEDAVRMPVGMAFDPNLDSDVMGDDLTGKTIIYVYRLGYYFPGNTIKPYRQKSVVVC